MNLFARPFTSISIWLRCGNIANSEITSMLEHHNAAIEEIAEASTNWCYPLCSGPL
jgi:predicted nuclease of predicted toxin-antitoxin system